MTIAFQYDTGYNIISHQSPLADQIPYFKAGFAKAIQAGQLVSNTGKSYNSCFAVGSVCSIRSLVGSDAPGVHRRPFLSDETLLHIGKNITLMFDGGGNYNDQPYSIQHFGTTPTRWIPDVILDIQARVQKRKMTSRMPKRQRPLSKTKHSLLSKDLLRNSSPLPKRPGRTQTKNKPQITRRPQMKTW